MSRFLPSVISKRNEQASKSSAASPGDDLTTRDTKNKWWNRKSEDNNSTKYNNRGPPGGFPEQSPPPRSRVSQVGGHGPKKPSVLAVPSPSSGGGGKGGKGSGHLLPALETSSSPSPLRQGGGGGAYSQHRRGSDSDIISSQMSELLFPDLNRVSSPRVKKNRSHSLDSGTDHYQARERGAGSPMGSPKHSQFFSSRKDKATRHIKGGMSVEHRLAASSTKGSRLSHDSSEANHAGSEGIISPKGSLQKAPTRVTKDIKLMKKHYDELVVKSNNGKGTVTMDVLEKDMLSSMKGVARTSTSSMLAKMRRTVKDENSITFKQILRIHFPETSLQEIDKMVEKEKAPKRKKSIYEAPSDETLHDLNDMWNGWDTEGIGELNKSQFKQALRSLGVTDLDEFDRIYKEVDTSQNGFIDKPEFLAWWFYGNANKAELFEESCDVDEGWSI